MAKRAPRLQFTEEERASPELAPAIRKADKRIKKLEKAEAKIPKKEPVFLLLPDVPGRKLFHCCVHLSVSG